MDNWNTDKIIGLGLIIALVTMISGNIAIALYSGTYPPTDLPMNIVTGLAGYMGRSLLEKQKAEKTGKEEQR